MQAQCPLSWRLSGTRRMIAVAMCEVQLCELVTLSDELGGSVSEAD
jgi:hypothetical protein